MRRVLCWDHSRVLVRLPSSPCPIQYWIDEFNACNYVANVYSIQGCPLECPRAASGQLCSGNGVCGFDNNLFKARCFCNDDCEWPHARTSTCSPARALPL